MTLLDPVPALTLATLGQRAEQVLERLGDAPSLFFEGVWHTSGDLAGRARRAAGGFAALGVGAGDRVLVCMTNCPEVGITYSALWRAGAVPTPVLFLLTEDELRHVVRDSGAKAVVTTPEWLVKVQAAAPGLPVVVVGGGTDAAPGTVAFEEVEGGTKVTNRAAYTSAEALKTVMDLGMLQGVAETWDRLAEHLGAQQS